MLLSYSTGSYVDYNLYTKTDTDNLLANKVSTTGDATIRGTVSAQQAILTSSDADHLPLGITRNGSSWFLGEYIASETNSGCLFKYKTAPGEWWSGVWGTNTNEFKIWFNYKGLSIKPTGDAVISGNLDVNVSNNRSSIKAYSTMDGYMSYVELEAKWNSQGYLSFESN